MRKRKGEGLTAAIGMSFQTLAQPLPLAEAGLTIAFLWLVGTTACHSFTVLHCSSSFYKYNCLKKSGFSETRV